MMMLMMMLMMMAVVVAAGVRPSPVRHMTVMWLLLNSFYEV